jgi:cyclohexanecarboxylate-CoA ligase
LRSLLTEAARAHPDRVAAIDHREGAEPVRRTYAELDALAHRYACGLYELGVRAGDAVAVMLPNSSDYAALMFATAELGAVYTGIPVAYGERETRAILRASDARVIIVPDRVRNDDHLGMIRGLRPGLPLLRQVVVAQPRRDLAAGECGLGELAAAAERVLGEADPFAVCQYGFTSGTTGEPKAAMNTHQTLEATIRALVEHIGEDGFGTPMTLLVASPMGHHTGYIWGALLSAYLASTAVYLDRWQPDRGAEVIRAERVTALFGAPTFLQDLLRTDLDGDSDCPLRIAVLAGAPVPRTLPAEGAAALGAYICPAWGMTEYGIAIAAAPHLPEPAQRTDGVPVPRAACRIVDLDGAPVGPGHQGELQVRGPGLFVGYRNRPEANESSFVDGWFRTGDNALVRGDGYIELHGRSKDIVIRGGENIPVTQVESLLFEHPQVQAAAIVGAPDPRLGERAAAFVVPEPGAELTLTGLCDFLTAQGLSKHYLPEQLHLIDELPTTPSGKIRKTVLRARLAEGAA